MINLLTGNKLLICNCRMESKPITTIYYDKNSCKNHNPGFGSLECGERIGMNLRTYEKNGYKIVGPVNRKIYKKVCCLVHSTNPVIKYIFKQPFHRNFIKKIIGNNPSEMQMRNCQGCTFSITTEICPMCQTKNIYKKFFKFIYAIDSSIPDSDTTYITHTSYSAILSSISLVCQMVESKNNGFAIVRPPGHHASSQKSQGFCLVNNIAICAEYALYLGIKKIFIFDFDAHHGNGTQNIFYKRKNVFFCSIHTADGYPKTGHENEIGEEDGYGFNLNVIVPKGVGTDEYINAFNNKVFPIIKWYNPDIILVSAGFDGLASDPMQLMKLTPECYQQITKLLASIGKQIYMVLEGGYDIENIPICIDYCIKELEQSNY